MSICHRLIGGASGGEAATSGTPNLSKKAIYGGFLSNCSAMEASHCCPSQLGTSVNNSPPPLSGAAPDDSAQSYALSCWLLFCYGQLPTTATLSVDLKTALHFLSPLSPQETDALRFKVCSASPHFVPSSSTDGSLTHNHCLRTTCSTTPK
ncbi:uncharacterized protein LOC119280981 [Triticum dicoccoides]|uniref:uncharacterized protein LOC119280981 n=1 Tax=Triticum dicoccoides TaxID=85692 RepID=UPI00188E0033|nr:uncharacterized protein LOC119280981 [Triticum dicoccoides]